ncbi:MAG: RNA polymerase sigma factor [Pseudomonadota bacterium]|nr:RNA polymerase sigma factor [Pseudomonadota bacterium]
MNQADDHTLARQAQAGNRRAFAVLVERHYGLMFRVAWKWCGMKDQAEDIAQEAAIKLARHIDAFRFESAFTTWLYRLVLNTARGHAKARQRHAHREQPLHEDGVYVSNAPSPEQQLAHKDVVKALARLPEALRETVLLVCWQGLSHREAGAVLECSEGTVSWRIHEARKQLAGVLDGSGEVRHG